MTDDAEPKQDRQPAVLKPKETTATAHGPGLLEIVSKMPNVRVENGVPKAEVQIPDILIPYLDQSTLKDKSEQGLRGIEAVAALAKIFSTEPKAELDAKRRTFLLTDFFETIAHNPDGTHPNPIDVLRKMAPQIYIDYFSPDRATQNRHLARRGIPANMGALTAHAVFENIRARLVEPSRQEAKAQEEEEYQRSVDSLKHRRAIATATVNSSTQEIQEIRTSDPYRNASEEKQDASVTIGAIDDSIATFTNGIKSEKALPKDHKIQSSIDNLPEVPKRSRWGFGAFVEADFTDWDSDMVENLKSSGRMRQLVQNSGLDETEIMQSLIEANREIIAGNINFDERSLTALFTSLEQILHIYSRELEGAPQDIEIQLKNLSSAIDSMKKHGYEEEVLQSYVLDCTARITLMITLGSDSESKKFSSLNPTGPLQNYEDRLAANFSTQIQRKSARYKQEKSRLATATSTLNGLDDAIKQKQDQIDAAKKELVVVANEETKLENQAVRETNRDIALRNILRRKGLKVPEQTQRYFSRLTDEEIDELLWIDTRVTGAIRSALDGLPHCIAEQAREQFKNNYAATTKQEIDRLAELMAGDYADMGAYFFEKVFGLEKSAATTLYRMLAAYDPSIKVRDQAGIDKKAHKFTLDPQHLVRNGQYTFALKLASEVVQGKVQIRAVPSTHDSIALASNGIGPAPEVALRVFNTITQIVNQVGLDRDVHVTSLSVLQNLNYNEVPSARRQPIHWRQRDNIPASDALIKTAQHQIMTAAFDLGRVASSVPPSDVIIIHGLDPKDGEEGPIIDATNTLPPNDQVLLENIESLIRAMFPDIKQIQRFSGADGSPVMGTNTVPADLSKVCKWLLNEYQSRINKRYGHYAQIDTNTNPGPGEYHTLINYLYEEWRKYLA